MSILGNILWFILGGFIIGLIYIIMGILYCLTIIGIPFGYQLMKIGVFTFFPFGRTPDFRNGQPDTIRLVLNIIWIVQGWWVLAVIHAVVGLLCCITVVGIPFGIQHFKIIRIALLPFGSTGKK